MKKIILLAIILSLLTACSTEKNNINITVSENIEKENILILEENREEKEPIHEEKVDEEENKEENIEPEEVFTVEYIYPEIDENDPYINLNVLKPTETFKPTEKTIYLTFDDGPTAYTNEILDILKEYNIKATFFVCCQSATQRSDESIATLQRIVDEGHTIGIHTYSHVYETVYASLDSYLTDFQMIFDFVYENTGVTADIFRFPGGSLNQYNTDIIYEIIDEMESRGFTYYDWNVVTNDSYGSLTAIDCVDEFKRTLDDKYFAIVLMHDTKEITAESLEYIILYSLYNGYNLDQLTNLITPTQFVK